MAKPTKRWIWIMIVGLYFGAVIANLAWDSHAFNKMSPAEHLLNAKSGLQETTSQAVEEAITHATAIPKGSAGYDEAQELVGKLQAVRDSITNSAAAQQKQQEQTKAARKGAVEQLQTDLKNLGYQLTVDESDAPDKIIITSADFDDTDHRVRFLSFVRGKNTPMTGTCWFGFRQIELRTSKIPFVGFSETYALSCF